MKLKRKNYLNPKSIGDSYAAWIFTLFAVWAFYPNFLYTIESTFDSIIMGGIVIISIIFLPPFIFVKVDKSLSTTWFFLWLLSCFALGPGRWGVITIIMAFLYWENPD